MAKYSLTQRRIVLLKYIHILDNTKDFHKDGNRHAVELELDVLRDILRELEEEADPHCTTAQ